ncbi:MAG TPA: alcohol dehydrogenase catalytic domain-containing protein, partial [Candidatus Binatia bacterium]|nr:alcohol dehydrogenase catalytic domain-containing protein [Candidatus Binatia bacterium]
MRAVVLSVPAPVESAPLRCETRSVPSPANDEILVRVSACGVCRTDLHLVEGELPLVSAPIVPGHQVVGRVERGGSDARRFRPGERVGIAWLRRTCGACDPCRTGRENLCARAAFTGYHADGGFADYAVAPERFAYAIPPVFGDAEAAPL